MSDDTPDTGSTKRPRKGWAGNVVARRGPLQMRFEPVLAFGSEVERDDYRALADEVERLRGELEKARYIEVHDEGETHKVRAVDYLNAVLAQSREFESERDAVRQEHQDMVEKWKVDMCKVLDERDRAKSRLAQKTDAHDRDGKALVAALATVARLREGIGATVKWLDANEGHASRFDNYRDLAGDAFNQLRALLTETEDSDAGS